jgi:hypothetical protein
MEWSLLCSCRSYLSLQLALLDHHQGQQQDPLQALEVPAVLLPNPGAQQPQQQQQQQGVWQQQI